MHFIEEIVCNNKVRNLRFQLFASFCGKSTQLLFSTRRHSV